MKGFCIVLVVLFNTLTSVPNKSVSKVDLHRYAGKWYSLYSIPTVFDKGSRETTTTYTWNKQGFYNVLTCAKKDNDNEIHTYNSKLFPDNDACGQMKAQFLWPFKIDYWIIDLADDYSWVVVGHPDHKFLFIMSRKPSMDKKLYEQILAKCKEMGYPVEKLTCQGHKG